MAEKELWEFFHAKKIDVKTSIGKDFIWVLRKDFNKVKKYFKKDFNIFHPGRSYRSFAFFQHIHAIKQGKYFSIHKDFGNISRFFPLGLLHFICDVIPFLCHSLIKRKPLKDFLKRPFKK